MRGVGIALLPVAQRWGGGPSNEDSMVEGSCSSAGYPSTIRFAANGPPPQPVAREELK